MGFVESVFQHGDAVEQSPARVPRRYHRVRRPAPAPPRAPRRAGAYPPAGSGDDLHRPHRRRPRTCTCPRRGRSCPSWSRSPTSPTAWSASWKRRRHHRPSTRSTDPSRPSAGRLALWRGKPNESEPNRGGTLTGRRRRHRRGQRDRSSRRVFIRPPWCVCRRHRHRRRPCRGGGRRTRRPSGGRSAVATSPCSKISRPARDLAVERFGGVDLVMNNVGVLAVGRVEDIPLDAWQRIIDINCLGVVRSNLVFLPVLHRTAIGPRREHGIDRGTSALRLRSAAVHRNQARHRRAVGIARCCICARRELACPACARPASQRTSSSR